MAEPDGTVNHDALDTRICFLGDSFVAGVGDPTAHGWVGRIVAAAFATGLPFTAYNLGIRGQTGPQIAARAAAEVPPRLHTAAKPRIVVSFGANDTAERGGNRRSTVVESVAALEHIRATTSIPLLMVGPPAVADHQHNRRLVGVDAALRDSSLRLEVPYVSTFAATSVSAAWRGEISAGDGFHPGASGYDTLARIIEPHMLRWLRSHRS